MKKGTERVERERGNLNIFSNVIGIDLPRRITLLRLLRKAENLVRG